MPLSRQAAEAGKLADEAQLKVSELETDYEAAIALLRQKEQTSASARERARRLLDRANALALQATGQVEELRGQFSVHGPCIRGMEGSARGEGTPKANGQVEELRG